MALYASIGSHDNPAFSPLPSGGGFFCVHDNYCSAEHHRKNHLTSRCRWVNVEGCLDSPYNYHNFQSGHHDNISYPLRNANDIFRKE